MRMTNLKYTALAPCACGDPFCLSAGGTVRLDWATLVHPAIPPIPQFVTMTPADARRIAASLIKAAHMCEDACAAGEASLLQKPPTWFPDPHAAPKNPEGKPTEDT